MTRLAAQSQRRAGFTLIELLVVIAIMTILIALLLPAVQQVRMSAMRTQTTNNLHQCSLAAITFHDANGWLPYNGTTATPANGVTDSGSWAYQITPYIEQQAVFNTQTSTTLPASWASPIRTLLDPMRPRPGYFTGSLPPSATVTPISPAGALSGTTTVVSPANVVGIGTTGTLTLGTGTYTLTVATANGATGTITSVNTSTGATKTTPFPGTGLSSSNSSGATTAFPGFIGPATVTIQITSGKPVPDSGPATDFGINPFINQPQFTANSTLTAANGTPTLSPGGGASIANAHKTLLQIADGTSNTILIGEMYCAIADYPLTQPVGSASTSIYLPIFQGGTWSTTRSGQGNSATTWLQDGTATTSNQWGSPMSYGGLMAMADGSVHLIPYTMSLQNLLEPNDGNTVVIP